MDKKESLLKQKAEAEKEARQYENQVKILLNKQRDAERTARNHRLIVHGAIMEGVFPFTASMDGESLKAFLIALFRLPEASEAAKKAQETGDEELLYSLYRASLLPFPYLSSFPTPFSFTIAHSGGLVYPV